MKQHFRLKQEEWRKLITMECRGAESHKAVEAIVIERSPPEVCKTDVDAVAM